ncbi:hypothetical protein T440DRAFT_541761 [Plenodomus tracheiphilus IPT5]|uniref:DJ-1/PfpI domain-containing protein n=1 Tax=Plenodomus tracheiphilus IPT5 TaxID=1408161 RepID=A0A6A7AUC6_9PLEO|nr:hypothetical protein T440DRAFT_541761 [Plenodomus tracheiphilus IPT5]
MSSPMSHTAFPSQADLFYYCTTASISEGNLSARYGPPSKSSLRIGVVVLGQEQVQLLDIAVVDLFASLGRNRFSKTNASEAAIENALDEVDIRYVNMTGEGSFPVTSGTRMPVTPSESRSGREVKNSITNAPRFDVLVVPGTVSISEIPAAAASFIATQVSSPDLIAVMSIASGVRYLAQAGILHRQRAAAPKYMLADLESQFPQTFWQQSGWARHESIWSSKSAVSALDMVAAWIQEYFWDRTEVVEHALTTAGISLHDEYTHCDY